MLKAFVVSDSKGKFKDLEDVIKIGRSLGQQAFKTRDRVKVLRIYGPEPFGYVVVVEYDGCCSDSLGVGDGSRK